MTLVTGLGVKREKAEKALLKSVGDLAEGETVWFYAKCANNFRPAMDAVVVTSQRVLGLLAGMGNHQCPYQAAVGDITDTAADPAHGTFTVRTGTGEMTFKRMAAEDVRAAEYYASQARQGRHDDQSDGPPGVSSTAPAQWDPTAQARSTLIAAMQTRTTVFGHRATLETLTRHLPGINLLDGEFVWAYAKCNNLSPMMDGVLVTNARLFGVAASGLQFVVAHPQIGGIGPSPKRGHLALTVTDGRSVTFKGMDPADITMVATCLDLARENPAAATLAEAVSETVEAHRVKHAPTPQEKQAAQDQKRQDRHDEKARKAAQKAADAAEALERYGQCVLNDMFGAKTIRIYDKGYVRVAFLALGSKAPYERLIDIETSVDVQKKSGLGRGVGAVMTMGVNLAASNKRGDVWITVITEDRTHTLHEDPPTSSNIATAKKIGGVGQSVIRRAATQGATEQALAPPATPTVAAPAPALAERLRQLNSLLADGLITEDEHEQKRARLLDEL